MKRNIRILIVIGLVAIVGIGGYFVWQRSNNSSVMNDEQFAVFSTKVDNQIANKEYNQAAASLDEFINSSPNDAQVGQAMLKLATVRLNEKNYAEATKWYTEAQKKVGTLSFASYVGLAMAAENQGNKQQAIDAYKQAITLLKANAKLARAGLREYYEQKVIDLGGSL